MARDKTESAAQESARRTEEAQQRDETTVLNANTNPEVVEHPGFGDDKTGTYDGGIDTGTAPASNVAGPGVQRADGSVAPAE